MQMNWDLIWEFMHLSSFRHEETGLVGNVLDVHTGEWMGKVTSKNLDKTPQIYTVSNWGLQLALDIGVRAGSWGRQLLRDPSQELHYVWRGSGRPHIAAAVQNLNILTMLILFLQDAEMFHVSYDKIKQYMRRGR